jgi:hypothetical protein
VADGDGVAVGLRVAEGVGEAHVDGEADDAGAAARCHSSSPESHWCGSGVRNSKYSTAPDFSLTHANTYWLDDWIARTCGDEALAESAQPAPMPPNATTLAARVIFSLGGANTCPGRIGVLS